MNKEYEQEIHKRKKKYTNGQEIMKRCLSSIWKCKLKQHDAIFLLIRLAKV